MTFWMNAAQKDDEEQAGDKQVEDMVAKLKKV